MTSEVLADLQNIQKYVYGEYKGDGSSNIEWLSVSFEEKNKKKILTDFLSCRIYPSSLLMPLRNSTNFSTLV